MTTLETKKLNVGYSKNNSDEKNFLIKDIEIIINQGDFAGLLGANGTGKTTFFKTLVGLSNPLSGEVLIEKKLFNEITQKEKAKIIGIVTTERPSNLNITVWDVILLGRYPYLTGMNYSKKDKEIVVEVIERLSLEKLAKVRIGELSDGQKQKVMIARALVQETKYLLLDEPFTFLDIGQKEWLFNFLKEYSKKENVGILFSSHDRFITENLSLSFGITKDKTMVQLRDGQIKKYLDEIRSDSILF